MTTEYHLYWQNIEKQIMLSCMCFIAIIAKNNIRMVQETGIEQRIAVVNTLVLLAKGIIWLELSARA